MPKSDLSIVSGDYAPVADRIALFWARYPNGRIITDILSRSEREVTVRARIYRSADERRPVVTGLASEREGDGDINTVACLENTETSAIGRALANLGFTASPNRPSAEEMQKVARERARFAYRAAPPSSGAAEPQTQGGEPSEVDGSSADHADLAEEVLHLLDTALRLGLGDARATALRERLLSDPPAEAVLLKWERRLRAWLRQHDAWNAGGAGDAGGASGR